MRATTTVLGLTLLAVPGPAMLLDDTADSTFDLYCSSGLSAFSYRPADGRPLRAALTASPVDDAAFLIVGCAAGFVASG